MSTAWPHFLGMTSPTWSPSYTQFSLLLQLFKAFFEDKFILFIAFVLRLMRTNILANAGAEMTSPPGAVAQMCSNIYHIMGYTHPNMIYNPSIQVFISEGGNPNIVIPDQKWIILWIVWPFTWGDISAKFDRLALYHFTPNIQYSTKWFYLFKVFNNFIAL